MAEWRPIHQPLDFRSGLETGGKSYDPPLLPYEVALIEALGCSEAEYKAFVRYAAQRAYVRPAEYDNIPEVHAAMLAAIPIAAAGAKTVATTIAINIAIGLALTAVSILLAPKAPALESPAKIRGKKLADQIGPTSFNQTTSFDSVSSLAEYGQPIPIPFGNTDTGSDGLKTGGLSLAPALVWSRVYSHGSFQYFEGLYVVGEYGLPTPAMTGIRVGTFALDSLGDREFAVFWKSQLGNNFPTTKIGGTVGIGPTGTAGRNIGQVFYAPGTGGEFTRSTSIAYNPQSQYQFGTATPIHNGTGFRFNWEIISAPKSSTLGEDNDEARFEIRAKRRKIAGSDADVLHKYEGQPAEDLPKIGQPGVGRAYSRRMGIVAHNGTYYDNRTTVTANVDDTIIFEIQGDNWRDFQISDFTFAGKRTQVDLKDLKAAATAWRQRASELLTIGSRWIISGSIWIIESRSPSGIWQPGLTMSITLRCVAIVGVPTIGVAGLRTVREPLGGYDGLLYNDEKHCGAGFFTLTRLYMSSIRPVRQDCVAIEFGIKSQVWNRASGLCNFNAIPTPSKLYSLDTRDITLTTPRMDKYFARSSCFSVMVRIVAAYGQPENTWHRIPELFCVTGVAPIDQYNYLRIKPRTPGKYEYRFIPRPGSDIAQNSIDSNTAIQLSAENGAPLGRDYATPIGTFRVTTTGTEVVIASILANEEMFTDPTTTTVTSTETLSVPSSVEQSAVSSNTGSAILILNAWASGRLGAYAWQYPGQTLSVTFTMVKEIDPAKTLTIRFSATSLVGIIGVNIGQDYLNATDNSTWKWSNFSYEIVGATGVWNVGDTIKDVLNVNNVFSNYAGYSQVNIQFKATALTTQVVQSTAVVNEEGRVFEQQSQVADVSHFQELQKSNENGPEHEIVYINEFVDNNTEPSYQNMSTVGLAIKSSGQINSVNQLRIFSPQGILVNRLLDGAYGPSNNFADLVNYLLRSKGQGVGNIVPQELIDTESLVVTARYLNSNKIFFDGVLEDSNSLRTFLYDTAALQLCNFTIKNGRFGMMPALPYDSSYRISTSPIAVEQIFTAGNIIQDSLQVQYIDAAQRSNFRALVTWRVTIENDLPTQASALVDWQDIPEQSRSTTQQTFDLTDFCTNRAQALKTARFLLSVRRRITHTISFKTVPDALGIQPGSYIRVITEATTYSATNNGGITDAGSLVSISTIADGNYDALIYNPSTSAVTEQRISIQNNAITDPALYGCLFTLVSLQTNASIYQVEQLTLDEDGIVNVSAVEVPVDASGVSIVAKDVLTETNFRVLE